MPKSASARGRSSRQKGQRGEREFAAELVRLFALHGIETKARRTAPLQAGANRGLLPEHVDAADVTCELLPDVHPEVKRQERILIDNFCHQAEMEAGEGRKPLLAWRRNRQRWRVAMPLETYVAERAARHKAEQKVLDLLWELDSLQEQH